MQSNPLVSIVTPCLNGESFVSRFLDSVLAQTYDNIQMIFVDDGSTDKTKDIVLSYKNKFHEKGYSFFYLYQDNAGQAAAINTGLQYVQGKYLTWPDCDDILDKDNIRLKVKYLEANPDYGTVACKVRVVKEDNINKTIDVWGNTSKNLSFDMALLNKVPLCPGIYMIRTQYFFSLYPDKKIYESRAGQNWQILLPMVETFRYGYIQDILYTYVIRDSSHSHTKRSLQDNLDRIDEIEEILRHSLSLFNNKKREDLLNKIRKKYMLEKLFTAIDYLDKDAATRLYYEICKNKLCTMRCKRKYYFFLIKYLIKAF